MALFRLIAVALIAYLGYHFFKGLFPGGSSRQDVKGRPENTSLDLSNSDVEDAKYREVKDKDEA